MPTVLEAIGEDGPGQFEVEVLGKRQLHVNRAASEEVVDRAVQRALSGLLLLAAQVDVGQTPGRASKQYGDPLEQVVGCWVEDTHFDKKTYYKVKQLVDADTITIREMHRNAYTLPNFCHFMQSGNSWDDFYIETEDTRATLIEVAPLSVTPIDWQGELRDLLEQEAPAFLATVFSTSLPPKDQRTTLPALGQTRKRSSTDRAADATGAWMGGRSHRREPLGRTGEWGSATPKRDTCCAFIDCATRSNAACRRSRPRA